MELDEEYNASFFSIETKFLWFDVNITRENIVEDNVLDDIDINYSFADKGEELYIIIDEYAIAPRSEGAQTFVINKADIG